MSARSGLRGGSRRRPPRDGSRPDDPVKVLCLLVVLSGLSGLAAGCGGGGGLAPVESPASPLIPGSGREHVVGKGDTVYSIAWRYGVDYRALARFNEIPDPSTIRPGQRLLIPEPGDVVPPDPEPDPRPDPRPNTATTQAPAPADDVRVRPIGAQTALALEPLPSPAPAPTPAAKVPGQSLPEAPVSPSTVPAPPVSPSTVPAPPVSPPAASETPAAQPAPASKAPSSPPAEPPAATRVAAGLRWSRPAKGKVIGSYGRGGNKGLDIAGTFEQPVHAASRGKVVYAGSGLVGYGNLIIVKHNDRLLSAYAHNESLYVKEGDDVTGGQHIADMGRSAKGRTMLHFEIRRDGKPVDPLQFLP